MRNIVLRFFLNFNNFTKLALTKTTVFYFELLNIDLIDYFDDMTVLLAVVLKKELDVLNIIGPYPKSLFVFYLKEEWVSRRNPEEVFRAPFGVDMSDVLLISSKNSSELSYPSV